MFRRNILSPSSERVCLFEILSSTDESTRRPNPEEQIIFRNAMKTSNRTSFRLTDIATGRNDYLQNAKKELYRDTRWRTETDTNAFIKAICLQPRHKCWTSLSGTTEWGSVNKKRKSLLLISPILPRNVGRRQKQFIIWQCKFTLRTMAGCQGSLKI
jgi:hypothetical protein